MYGRKVLICANDMSVPISSPTGRRLETIPHCPLRVSVGYENDLVATLVESPGKCPAPAIRWPHKLSITS